MKTNKNSLLSTSLYCFLILFFSTFLVSCEEHQSNKTGRQNSDSISASKKITALYDNDEWVAPDTASLPLNNDGNNIRYGRELVANTALYLGPSGKVRHISNGMNCQNCHLNAGTKLFANSFSAVYSIYPKFRARSGTIETLEKRINDCMERSLNGKKLDSLSKEMRAMVAYINWVGKDVKKGVTPKGCSVADLPYLTRPADSEKGKIAFEKNCISCHGKDGQGKHNADSLTYLYPPLWGQHSYNTAAGMHRLSRLAGYIKSNMPYLTSSNEKPILSDEEAWDIAAYLSSKSRPLKKFKGDWPDISKKPVDHPFGPYADNFTEQQHKFGPFGEIAKSSKKY